MINFREVGGFLKQHLPKILTGLGCIGVIGVAVTSAIAGAKTENEINELKKENPEIPGGEILKKVAKNYILPGVLTASTIGCIIGSERASASQLATALSTAGAMYVKNKFDILEKEPEEFDPASVTLFYDSENKEFFESTVSDVLFAEYELNRLYILRDYALYNDFCLLLGREPAEQFGDSGLGWYADYWNDYGYRWIDIDHSLKFTEEGRPYYIISFPFEPLPEPQYDADGNLIDPNDDFQVINF